MIAQGAYKFTAQQISGEILIQKTTDLEFNELLGNFRRLARYIISERDIKSGKLVKSSIKVTTGNALPKTKRESIDAFLQAIGYTSLENALEINKKLMHSQIVKVFSEWADSHTKDVREFLVDLDSTSALITKTIPHTVNFSANQTFHPSQVEGPNTQPHQSLFSNSQQQHSQNRTSKNSQIQSSETTSSQNEGATFLNYDILQKLNKLDMLDDIAQNLNQAKFMIDRKDEILEVLDSFTDMRVIVEQNQESVEHLDTRIGELEDRQKQSKSINYLTTWFRTQTITAAARRKNIMDQGNIRVTVESSKQEFVEKQGELGWPNSQVIATRLGLNLPKVLILERRPGKYRQNGEWLKQPFMRIQVNYLMASTDNTVPVHKTAENLVFTTSKQVRGDLQIEWDVHTVDKKIAESTFIEWKRDGLIFGYRVNKRAKYILFTEKPLAPGDTKVREHSMVSCPQNLVQLENPTTERIIEACQEDHAVYEGEIVEIKPPNYYKKVQN